MSVFRAIFVIVVSVLILGAVSVSASDLVTINQLRTGGVLENTVVDVRDVLVINVAESGLAIGDFEAGPYRNIWVKTVTEATVVPGDFVQIFNAVYRELDGLSVLDLTLEPGDVVFASHSSAPLPDPIVYTVQDFLVGHEAYESAAVTIDSSFYITIVDPISGWIGRAHPGEQDVGFSGLWIHKSQFQSMDCYENPVGLMVQEGGIYTLAPFTDGFQLGDCETANNRLGLAELKAIYR